MRAYATQGPAMRLNNVLETITVDRDSLYDVVWERPVTQVAAEYGVSDVGLRKICAKLGVPTPPRGYWAKLRHGKPVQRAPLPRAVEGAPTTHDIARRRQAEGRAADGTSDTVPAADGETGTPDATAAAEAPPAFTAPPVRVAKQLRRPHRLVKAAREALLSEDPDPYGRVGSGRARKYGIAVCRPNVGRELRIMDALFKAACDLGWTIQPGAGHKGEPAVVVHGQAVALRIMEKVTQEKQKSESPWKQWTYVYHPTGKLRLELTNSVGTRGRFTDGARGRPLDDQLSTALESMFEAAQAQKRREARERERERARQKQRALEVQQLQEREAELARRTALEKEAARWRQSQDLRAYIEAAEANACKQALLPESKAKLKEWLTWARAHADRLDPLKGDPLTEEPLVDGLP